MTQIPSCAEVLFLGCFCLVNSVTIVVTLVVIRTKRAVWNCTETVVGIAGGAPRAITGRAAGSGAAGASGIIFAKRLSSCCIVSTIAGHALVAF